MKKIQLVLILLMFGLASFSPAYAFKQSEACRACKTDFKAAKRACKGLKGAPRGACQEAAASNFGACRTANRCNGGGD
jgi:hypothetical protein